MVRRRPCASRFARARIVAVPVVLGQVAPGGVVAPPRRRARAGPRAGGSGRGAEARLVAVPVRGSSFRRWCARPRRSHGRGRPPHRVRPPQRRGGVRGRGQRRDACRLGLRGGEAELRQRDRHEVGRLDQGRRSRSGASARVGSMPRESAPVQRRRGRRRRPGTDRTDRDVESHRAPPARLLDGGRPAPRQPRPTVHRRNHDEPRPRAPDRPLPRRARD